MAGNSVTGIDVLANSVTSNSVTDNPVADKFVELSARSSFSFLRGASHPEEMIEQAKALGLSGITLCDRDGLYGVARAHARAREIGQALHIGSELPLALSELELQTGHADAILGALSDKQRRLLLPGAKPNILRKRLLAEDGYPTLHLIVKNLTGYQNLCWLLTRAHADLPKGECLLTLADLAGHCEGLIALLPTTIHPVIARKISGLPTGSTALPPAEMDAFSPQELTTIREAFGISSVYSLCYRRLNRNDGVRMSIALQRERRYGIASVASALPSYHCSARQRLADVLQCIRLGTTLSAAKTKIAANGQAYLRTGAQMARLFPEHLDWIERTAEVAAQLSFNLQELRYHFPCSTEPDETPDERLRKLSWAGAERRYPQGVPDKVRRQIETELALITRREVAPYFLSTWEVVEIARELGILCQGRGSAANSAVCYVLGITAVNPECSNLLFERFMSDERQEPPDIDVDFEHERREEVIQELYRRHGRDQAAMVSEVICYRRRSALREVAKVFGLSLDQSDRLAKGFAYWDVEDDDAATRQRVHSAGLDLAAPELQGLLEMAAALVGFPRHLSIHVGGFVLSSRPLHEVSPVEPARMAARSVVPWDKDDLDILGFFKIDVLALGMLTAVRKALHSIWLEGKLRSERPLPAGAPAEEFDSLEVVTRIPDEDPAVYALTSQADTVGVFQIESRAQMAMLPRLRPRCFYDLVIEVAIVRPGPIQGGMVHPYLRRRNGEEADDCQPILKDILARTRGVPLFQEQVMQIAIVGAGYSGGEADQLRRDMAAWKKTGQLSRHRQRLLDGFARNGIERSFGEAIFEQIKGFGEYGFPESHAASFASLVYKSAWLKAHYPAHFVCALLNSQPMGFYSAASLVKDAQKHGVEVRPVSVLDSDWDCTLEARTLPSYKEPSDKEPSDEEPSDEGPNQERALRLGLRMIKGLSKETSQRLTSLRSELLARGQSFTSFRELNRQLQLPKKDVEALAEAGAFEPLLRERRQVLWAAREPRQLGLFQGVPSLEPTVQLPRLAEIEVLELDYERVRLSLADHPLRHLRAQLRRRKVITAAELAQRSTGDRVAVAGLVLARQRPGTASGVVFVTLEDETGVANLVFYSRVFDEYRQAAQHSSLLLVRGKVERQDPKPGSVDRSDPRQKNGVASIIHLLVESAVRLSLPDRRRLSHTSRDFR